MHVDEVEVDAALVAGMLHTQLPDLAELPIRRVASGGTENAIFRLGDRLALRMPLQQSAVSGLLKEMRWLPVLRPYVRLETPTIVRSGRATSAYPFPWAVVRWLDGEDAMSASVDSTLDLAHALADFVADLRSIPAAQLPPPGSEGFTRGGPLRRRDEDFHTALPRCAPVVDVSRVATIWRDALVAPDWDGPPVWLHADLIAPNLLVRDGRLAGVLDFGAMATGDPAYDLIVAWFVLDAAGRRLFLDRVGIDDATCRRARGLVVSQSVIALPYYRDTNPVMVATALRGIAEVLSDVDG
jgi:aminoglycoside phosphotransferase (APT) family kinase protein